MTENVTNEDRILTGLEPAGDARLERAVQRSTIFVGFTRDDERGSTARAQYRLAYRVLRLGAASGDWVISPAMTQTAKDAAWRASGGVVGGACSQSVIMSGAPWRRSARHE